MADWESSAELWIVRHGATAWSESGRHTSHTEVPLEPSGEKQARALGGRLREFDFASVLSSPRLRAVHTAELAGFADPTIDPDLAEWDYGDYEGLTTADIRVTDPGWTIFTGSTPRGESADQVAERADRVIAQAVLGRTLVFTHGHFGRVLAARWLRLAAADGRYFELETATINVLGYERVQPVVLRWNA
ncbi:MAG: histidine phosphatase family protein [Marmoricola sp.]